VLMTGLNAKCLSPGRRSRLPLANTRLLVDPVLRIEGRGLIVVPTKDSFSSGIGQPGRVV
jgi:hypothetical protein